VRTAGNPAGVLAAVRASVANVDRDQPLTEIKTMDELLESLRSGQRFTLLLIGVLAGSAFFLAMIGIYGVISYAVAQQTVELGIRMALGASRSDILRLVVGSGMSLALFGLGIGVLASLFLTRLLAGQLYQTSTVDPVAYGATVIVFLGAAFLASYLPARGALRMELAEVLRAE
jgi:ABC-type antimicrobial peptide transport system permease subunit